MINNYKSLSSSRSTWLKKCDIEIAGSPPQFSISKTTKLSWLVMTVFLMILSLGQKSFGQTYFSENFEGIWYLNGNSSTVATAAGPNAPLGWSQTRSGTNLNSAPGTPNFTGARDWAQQTWSGTAWASSTLPNAGQIPYNLATNGPTGAQLGTNVLWMNDGWFGGLTGASRRLESPAFSLTSAASPIASFWYYYSAGSATVALVASSDGGLTWNTISASNYTGGIATWTNFKVAIPAQYKVANAKIGILLVSNSFGNNDIFIDNVEVLEGTPPSAAPTSLTFSGVTPSNITLNWVDNSTDETAFRVYRSTNAVNYSLVSSVTSTSVAGTGTAYTLPQTGLVPGTIYNYRIVAYKPEGETLPVSDSQATLAGTTYYWVGATLGTWSTAANWNTNPAGGGSVRTTPANSDVLIIDGAGFDAGGALTISYNVVGQTIGQLIINSNTNLTLQSDTTTTRTTTISGGPGDDLVIEAGSTLNLVSSTNACAFSFSGAGNTGLIAGTYNAAGSTSNVITTTGGTGTLVTVSGSVNNNIAGASGCMTGSVATLSFASGSNYAHGSFTTTNGFLPLATWATTSTVSITGGTTSTGITNAAQSFGNFVYNSTTSTATMSVWAATATAVIKGDLTVTVPTGGTAIFRALTTGTLNVTGAVNILQGRFQSASGAGNFIANGATNVLAAGILDILAGTYSQRGATLTNNGSLNGPLGTLQFFNLLGSFAQTFAGTGTVATTLATLSMQNTAGLTISHTNQIPFTRVNLFQGTITNSNKITFGTGLAVTCTTQIGSAGLTTPGGNFDAIPTFNLGTGLYNVLYSQESVARTSGFEIPLTRSVNAITNTNSNGLTIAGGPLATTILTFNALSGGNINTTAANLLTVTGTGTANIVRTLATAYINGPLAITLPASLATGSTYTLPIGKGTLNPFALVNPTTNAGGTVTVKAEAFDGAAGGTAGNLIGAISTSRYWAASITAGSANFTNSLLQLNDTTTGRDAIAASATHGGTYDLQGGVAITTTASSLTTTAPANTTLPGFFLMANKAAASLSALAITPTGNSCSNVTRTVTVNVTPGGAVVNAGGVVINYSINGVTQTAIVMTNTTANGGLLLDTWSGVIPTITPANANVTWSVTATDANTLAKTQAGTAYSDEPLFGAIATVNASSPNICGSGSSILTAKLIKSGGSATIGTATTLTSATSQPTAFCNRWASYRMQTVYTAAELIAAGLGAGNITAMALNISTLGDGATNSGFTVKIGSSSLSTLSGDFLATTAFTTVFPSQTYTHTASGIQTINFSTPYNWDGTSNIVVEMIHNGANAFNNSQTFFTATAGNTVAYTTTDAANAASFSSQRLNVVFTGNALSTISNVLWSDGSNGVTNTVSPTATTAYTAIITANGCTITTSPVTVNVVPVPTAPVAGVTAATCGNAVPLVSVTDPNGFATPTYKWYADNVTTTALQSSTSATYSTLISATTTFYVSVVNTTTSCESARTPITANVNTPDVVIAIANQSVCIGSGFTATASSINPAYTYTWTASPVLGSGIATSLTGATQTITPTALGTYTYTVSATDGICNTSITFTGTVNSFPIISSVSASPATGCVGVISTLTASVPTAVTSYILSGSTGTYSPISGTDAGASSIGDDTGVGNLPIGFPFNYNGVTQTVFGASSNGLIQLGVTSATFLGLSFNTLSTTANVIAPLWDDNNTAGGSIQYLTTGTAPNRVLTVQWTNMHVGGGGSSANPTISMQVRLFENGGFQYTYGPTSAALTSVTASVGYSGAVGVYRSVTPLTPASSSTSSTITENNAVTDANLPSGTIFTFSPPAGGNFTWAPTTGLFTDAAATTAYTGTTTSIVYAKPASTSSYIATLSSASGCNTVSSPVTITINFDPVANITGGGATMCVGSGTLDFDTATVGVVWSSSNTGVATIDGNGIVTAVSTGATIIGATINNPITGCSSSALNPQAIQVFAPLVVSTNPISLSKLPTETAIFTSNATGSVTGFQWKVSTNGGLTFTSLSNDATYSGVNTNTLTLTNVSIGLSNNQYLCSFSASSPCEGPLNSTAAILTVDNISITSQPISQEICVTGAGSMNFSVITSGPTPDDIVWELFNGSTWTVLDATSVGTFGAVTFSGETTPNLSLTGLSALANGWKVRVNITLTSSNTLLVSNEATITVNTPASFGASVPVNKTACYTGAISTFTAVATGGTGYQWQYSTDNVLWNSVVNGTPLGTTYSNITSSTLTVTTTSTTPAVGTYYYRNLASSASQCPSVPSSSAQLFINTPIISAAASSGVICSPGGTAVILTASGGSTYVWSPATGLSASTGALVTANPTVTTIYTVTGTDATGCSNTATVTVTVSNKPSILLTPSVSTVCPNGDVTLATTVTSASSAAAPTYCAVTNAGSSSVNSVSFNTLNNAVTQINPFVNSYPVSGATTTTVLRGQSYDLNVTTEGLSSIASVWFDFNKDGVYSAAEHTQLWISDVSGTASILIPLSASSGRIGMRIRSRSAGSSNGPTDSCTGMFSGSTQDYVITISDDTSAFTYAWTSVPAGFTSTIASPVVNPTASTTYNVVVTSPLGCSSSASTAITVQNDAIITTNPIAASVCQGLDANLTVVASGPSLSYQWRKNGVNIVGNASATSPNLTISFAAVLNSGSYDVVVTPICGAAATSTPVTLTVNPTPTVIAPPAISLCSVSNSTAIALTGTPSGVTFNVTGGAAIGLANQTGVTSIPVFSTIKGTATITITPNANGCAGTAVTFVITVNETPSVVIVTPATSTSCSTESAILLTGTGGIVAPTAYCIPTLGFTGITGDNITNFTFAGINNTTSDGPGDYNTYLSPSALVTAGTATPFSITPNAAFGQQFRVWIDMNQNGVFEASESVFATTASTISTVSGNITIPTTAFNGITRIRVADKFSTAILDSEGCGHTGFGEFEDYSVTISGGTIAPSPLYVWSSTNGGLFTNAGATTAYDGTPAATVYAKPNGTATITAKRTVLGCSSSASATVTVQQAVVLYADADGDSYTVGAPLALACYTIIPAGFTTTTLGTDCDDTNALIFRSAPLFTDADNDGYTVGVAVVTCFGAIVPTGFSLTSLGTDCVDNNPNINPGKAEVLYNGIDDNCDGNLDEGNQLKTKVQAAQCGQTLPLLTSTVYAKDVSYSGYRFRITNVLTGAVQIKERVGGGHWFRFNELASFDYDTQYSVEIEIQRLGVWLGYYGESCLVRTPSVVTTPGVSTLNAASCGANMTNLNQTLYATLSTGVTGYKFRISGGTQPTEEITRVQQWFTLGMFPTPRTYGTQYTIEVAVKTTGAYTNYGTACFVNTPSAPALVAASCGVAIPAKLTAINTVVSTSVTGYRFELTSPSNQVQIVNRVPAYFNLSNLLAGYTPNTIYQVRVAVTTGTSGVYSPYGPVCSITTPAGTARGGDVTNVDAITVVDQNFKVMALPNPFNTNFGLNMESFTDAKVEVKIYDMIGKLLESREVQYADVVNQNIGENYPSGVYNVIVSQGDNAKTLRVIKR